MIVRALLAVALLAAVEGCRSRSDPPDGGAKWAGQDTAATDTSAPGWSLGDAVVTAPCGGADSGPFKPLSDDELSPDPAPGCQVVAFHHDDGWGYSADDVASWDANGNEMWRTYTYDMWVVVLAYTYDEEGRLSTASLGYQGQGVSEFAHTYHYDSVGRTSSVDIDSPVDGVVDRTIDYAYDADGRVVSGARVVDGFVQGQDDYTYDAEGRLVEQTEETSVGTYIWTYDTDGHVLAYEFVVAVDWLEAYAYAYAYDQRGNLVSVIRDGSGTFYTYDDDDRLISVASGAPDDPDTVTDYQYNTAGDLARTHTTSGDWDYADVYFYAEDGRLRFIAEYCGCGHPCYGATTYVYVDACVAGDEVR